MPGYLLINKPTGPTSHDIVDRVRRMTGEKRVGHAGTLDPFASGLLIVGVGREATREFARLVGLDKHYIATLHLGATSDTDDRTGQISAGQMANGKWPTWEEIKSVIKTFTGKIQQLPPMYSAKKIHGKKMYELAREGKTFERQPVEIEIYSIAEAKPRREADPQKPEAEASPRQGSMLILDIHCSSGTYIRALARDIGEALSCGAYLEELERTAVGPFTLERAVKADELNKDNWEKYLMPVEQVLNRCQRAAGVLGWKQS